MTTQGPKADTSLTDEEFAVIAEKYSGYWTNRDLKVARAAVEADRKLRAGQSPGTAHELANRQAKYEGLWFITKTAPEAYLQQALRELHSAVEGQSAARAAGQATPEPVAWMKRTNVSAEWGAYDFSANQQPGFNIPLYLAAGQAIPIPDHAVCFWRDGNSWCCVHGDFENLQESPAGFGSSFDEALDDLALEKHLSDLQRECDRLINERDAARAARAAGQVEVGPTETPK